MYVCFPKTCNSYRVRLDDPNYIICYTGVIYTLSLAFTIRKFVYFKQSYDSDWEWNACITQQVFGNNDRNGRTIYTAIVLSIDHGDSTTPHVSPLLCRYSAVFVIIITITIIAIKTIIIPPIFRTAEKFICVRRPGGVPSYR